MGSERLKEKHVRDQINLHQPVFFCSIQTLTHHLVGGGGDGARITENRWSPEGRSVQLCLIL